MLQAFRRLRNPNGDGELDLAIKESRWCSYFSGIGSPRYCRQTRNFCKMAADRFARMVAEAHK